MRGALGALALGALLAAGVEAAPATPKPAATAAATADECLACHADRDLEREKPVAGRADSLFVDHERLKASTHGALDCVACHTTATAPHEGRLPAVRCDSCHAGAPAAVKQGAHAALAPGAGCTQCHGTHGVQRVAAAGPTLCAGCHAKAAEGLAAGVHRAGSGKAPTCATCHGTGHALRRNQDAASPVHRARLHETCATCHGEGKGTDTARPRAVTLFEGSIHGRAIRERGNLTAATCSDCHGAHDVRPGTERASLVFRGNVPATCAGAPTRPAGPSRRTCRPRWRGGRSSGSR